MMSYGNIVLLHMHVHLQSPSLLCHLQENCHFNKIYQTATVVQYIQVLLLSFLPTGAIPKAS